MPARTTRLLVLGTVRRLGPASGYEVQSHLFGLAADRWAGLRSGSIYAMLRSLTRAALIAVAPEDPGRYVTTEAGRHEHDSLTLGALRSLPDTGDTTELRAALEFADMLPPDAVRHALIERLAAIDGALDDITARVRAGSVGSSPFVIVGRGLQHALLRAQEGWLRDLLGVLPGSPAADPPPAGES